MESGQGHHLDIQPIDSLIWTTVPDLLKLNSEYLLTILPRYKRLLTTWPFLHLQEQFLPPLSILSMYSMVCSGKLVRTTQSPKHFPRQEVINTLNCTTNVYPLLQDTARTAWENLWNFIKFPLGISHHSQTLLWEQLKAESSFLKSVHCLISIEVSWQIPGPLGALMTKCSEYEHRHSCDDSQVHQNQNYKKKKL